jgi:hypothetical protein
MAQVDSHLSTGLDGLDKVFAGLIPGDNLVWHVDSIEEYMPFIEPYARSARRLGQKLIYFRFAKHRPLLPDSTDAEVHRLRPEEGFENFLAAIHRVIEQTGRGGFYVFDCLSDLAVDWYSDQMLGNFFMLTCPYLYDVEAIAYFALLRTAHSAEATSAISETAQVLIDVSRHKGKIYIHPLKVQQRFSPTMYMLHEWDGEEFRPMTESAKIAEIVTRVPWRRMVAPALGIGIWDGTFLEAEEVLQAMADGNRHPQREREIFRRLVRMAISRDDRVYRLIEEYMSLADLVEIGKRMIGTGLVGGKTVGMLLARAILGRHDGRWEDLLERHDSFFVGSDVFYTFLVRNGVWWVRQGQRDPQAFLEGAERARSSIIRGTFPDSIIRQFADMLDYFGQSPIIVRSSSLLEDNFGNAFAGKYESVFCANQGSRDKRLEDFLSAVRTIYASTMSRKALEYRAARGLLDRDEQMALLVMRVSGSVQGRLFYPHAAGVGFSYNPYCWSEEIDPEAGMLRLVFGLGTRAVDRADDDYTRVVALNAPHLRPEGDFQEVRKYAQRKVDVLNLEANQVVSMSFADVAAQSPSLALEMFASADEEQLRRAAETGKATTFAWVLTFEKLLAGTAFVGDMREMLSVLERAYEFPVDVEYTLNFVDGRHEINLVQCRPLPVNRRTGAEIPKEIPDADVVLSCRGPVIGPGRVLAVNRIIYVLPATYGQLAVRDRYAIARTIGQLTHLDGAKAAETILLMGPGRWGTTTPSLGVPAGFGEISPVSALCEIVAMRDDLVPDVSLGTHYFSDLVETDILYMAFFPNRDGSFLSKEFFELSPNRLRELLPEAAEWEHVIRVIDSPLTRPVLLSADSLHQNVLCYLRREEG